MLPKLNACSFVVVVDNNKLQIALNGVEIEQVMEFKYLGIHLDPLLNFPCGRIVNEGQATDQVTLENEKFHS